LAAEYVRRQDLLGSLERGKLADLLILGSRLLQRAGKGNKENQALLTMVGGKIVHQASNF